MGSQSKHGYLQDVNIPTSNSQKNQRLFFVRKMIEVCKRRKHYKRGK